MEHPEFGMVQAALMSWNTPDCFPQQQALHLLKRLIGFRQAHGLPSRQPQQPPRRTAGTALGGHRATDAGAGVRVGSLEQEQRQDVLEKPREVASDLN